MTFQREIDFPLSVSIGMFITPFLSPFRQYPDNFIALLYSTFIRSYYVIASQCGRTKRQAIVDKPSACSYIVCFKNT